MRVLASCGVAWATVQVVVEVSLKLLSRLIKLLLLGAFARVNGWCKTAVPGGNFLHFIFVHISKI